MNFKETELPEPWYWTDDDLLQQLRKEIGLNHNLRGGILKTLARRQDNDDVLFQLDNEKFVIVHLIWNESFDSKWPRFKIFGNWSETFDQILRDAEDFNADS